MTFNRSRTFVSNTKSVRYNSDDARNGLMAFLLTAHCWGAAALCFAPLEISRGTRPDEGTTSKLGRYAHRPRCRIVFRMRSFACGQVGWRQATLTGEQAVVNSCMAGGWGPVAYSRKACLPRRLFFDPQPRVLLWRQGREGEEGTGKRQGETR